MNEQKLECPRVRLDFPFALTANAEDCNKYDDCADRYI